MKPAVNIRKKAAFRAHASMASKCHQRGLWGSVDLRTRLFDTLITSVVDYGVIAWVSSDLLDPAKAHSNQVEEVQQGFIRYLLKLPKSAPLMCAYMECGSWPWQSRWIGEFVKWWRHCMTERSLGPQLSLTHLVMRHNVQLFVNNQVANWAASFFHVQSAIFPDRTHGLKTQMTKGHGFCPFEAQQAVQEQYQTAAGFNTEHDPRTPDVQHRVACTYSKWFMIKDRSFKDSFMCAPDLSYHEVVELSRFRLGCHPVVPVTSGRRAKVPYTQRLCSLCPDAHVGQVGHEQHILLECGALHSVRQRHRDFLSSLPDGLSMNSLSNAEDQTAMARFCLDCIHAYESLTQPGGVPPAQTEHIDQ